MSEANEEVGTADVVVNAPEDWAETFMGSSSTEPEAEPASGEEGQPKEATTPEPEATKEEEVSSPDTEETAKPERDWTWGTEWAGNHEREVLDSALDENGHLRPTEEVLTILRESGMRLKGHYKAREEVAQERKEQAALIRDGEEYRKLLVDDAEREAFRAFKEARADTPAEPERFDPADYDTDEEAFEAHRQRVLAEAKAERLREEEAAKQSLSAEESQFEESKAAIAASVDAVQAGEFKDVSKEEFQAALDKVIDDLEEEELPTAERIRIGSSERLLARRLRPHVAAIRADKKLKAVQADQEAASRAVKRAKVASTSPSRPSEITYDETTEDGIRAKLREEFGGKSIIA